MPSPLPDATNRPHPPALLGDPRLRDALVAAVRRRVPHDEVEEIVQSTLADALAARSLPEADEEIRRFVFGIARHKVVDFHRRRGREVVTDAVPEEAHADAFDAVDLLRWAEREAPSANGASRTFEWMLREGEGEKLEEIARTEAIPAPQVRQRVSRMRRHFRSRWAQLVAAALISAIAIAVLLLRRREPDQAKHAPKPHVEDPIARGRELRKLALEGPCARADWSPCISALDEAAALDPAGDAAEEVQSLRRAAKPVPPPSPSPAPSPPPAPSPSPAPTSAPTPAKTAAPKTNHPPAPTKPVQKWGGGKGKKPTLDSEGF